MRDELKVGVFLCECGGNIADIVDLDRVREELDVEFIGQFENLCSLNGRKIIRDAIFDMTWTVWLWPHVHLYLTKRHSRTT